MTTVRCVTHATPGEPTGITQSTVKAYMRELAMGNKRGATSSELVEGLAQQTFVISGGGGGQVDLVRSMVAKLTQHGGVRGCTSVCKNQDSTKIYIHRPIRGAQSTWILIEMLVIVCVFVLSGYYVDEYHMDRIMAWGDWMN